MLRIFICEDNDKQRKNIEKIINNIVLFENYDMQLELSTSDPYEIIAYIKSTSSSGIYFLDVDLHSDINGIQLAEQIRKHDPRGFIIFITTHAEMSYLTFLYKVEAMDYIIKDNYKNVQMRIAECIENAHQKYICKATELQKIFSVKVDDKIINVDFNEIIFFETSQTIHKVILHGCNRQLEFYGKMKDVEKLLDERFYRCHNSYIINRDKIKKIDIKKRIAFMNNDEECFISTRAIKELTK